MKGTVSGSGNTGLAPSGQVQFVDVTSANAVVGSAVLSPSGSAFSLASGTAPSFKADTVAAGDFNNDGHADVIAFDGSGNLNVALGNGDGTFRPLPAVQLLSYTYINAIAIGDFNADGKSDFAVVYGGNSLTILLGNGDGTFTLGSSPSVEKFPSSIAVGDFNGDGRLDLAVANDQSSEVSILLGNADGTFVSAPPLSTAAGPGSVVTADFDSEGVLDLAVLTLTNYTVSIFHGNGDGAFTALSTPAYVGFDIESLATADVNGDGSTDILVAGPGSGPIPLLGHGDGTFKVSTLPAFSIALPSGPRAIADFNGDGQVDVAVLNANSNSATGPYVFMGKGDGTFTPNGPFAGLSSSSIAVGDFNGDGTPDIVFVNGYTTTSQPLMLLLGQSGLNATATATAVPLIGTGAHQVKAVYTGDTNFAGSSSAALGLIAAPVTPALTLSANPTFGTYGQQILLTATLAPYAEPGLSSNGESGNFYSGFSLLGSAPLTSGVATLSVTSIGAGVNSLTSRYGGDADLAAVTSAAVSFTNAQATPAITWTPPASAVYTGKAVGTLLNAISNVGGFFTYAATPTGGTSMGINANSILSVGTYTLTAKFTPSDATDYTTTNTNSTYTVSPATLTVVPVNVTRVYGAANPALSATVPGALNNDIFTVAGSTTATGTSAVGSYPITYTVTGSNLTNYTVVNASGTLTILQATPSLTWNTPAPITYGTALTAAQLNAASSTAGTLSYSPALGAVLGAGIQTLSVTFTPTDSTDFVSSTVTTRLVVNQAPLIVTGADAVRVFGSANPAFAGTVIGAVNGDSFVPSFATIATVASTVGKYPIVPSANGPALANYAPVAVIGTLTVTQATTATALSLSNQNLTLTANFTSLVAGTSTGSVGFYARQTLIGTGTLSNGVASYTASFFPSGNAVLSAQYSGDVNFTASAATPISFLTVAPSAISLTVTQNGSVTDTINLSVPSGYVGTLQISCSGLPANAACSFQPATAVFSGAVNTASIVLTVQTSGSHATNVRTSALPNHGMPLFAFAFCRAYLRLELPGAKVCGPTGC